ncbi:MAG: hypothetical protein K1X89_31025 [Myxococcaceae bacterium]|nr:hypothetical protein [Myxococcaceae bacterium]
MPSRPTTAVAPAHSPAWMVQVWISWVLAFGSMLFAIWLIQGDLWMKGFLFIGLVFTVGSTFSLSKTLRDLHESERVVARVDEARLEQLLAQHDPLKPAI